MKGILITGGAGFIGSNFIPYFLKKNEKLHVINIDKLTYAGNIAHLEDVKEHPNYTFVQGDIVDKVLVNTLFVKYDIKGVLHFAAESHVDNSITAPQAFIKTNIEGTFTLLEAARKHWMQSPHNAKKEYKDTRFHHISTDEVYGTLKEEGFFTEKTPLCTQQPIQCFKSSIRFSGAKLLSYLRIKCRYYKLFQQLWS